MLLFVVCFYVKNIFRKLILAVIKKVLPLQSNSEIGALAQLVEQRTENPCVPSSILGGTTIRKVVAVSDIFLYYRINFKVMVVRSHIALFYITIRLTVSLC